MKSFPLKRSGSFNSFTRAQEKQSTKLSCALARSLSVFTIGLAGDPPLFNGDWNDLHPCADDKRVEQVAADGIFFLFDLDAGLEIARG